MLKRVKNYPEPEAETAQRESPHSRPHHSATVHVVVVHVDVVVVVIVVVDGVIDELALVGVSEENVPNLRLL